jgi:type VI secretion system protein
MLALLVRVDNIEDGSTRSFTLTRSPARLGRNPLNDLALPWPFVSQWHAVVQFDDTQAAYYDLGSTNGTSCNGQRLGKNTPVAIVPQLQFRVGKLVLTFSRGHVAADATGAPQRLMGPQGDAAMGERTMIGESLNDSLGSGPAGSTVMLDATALLADLHQGAGPSTAQGPRPAAGTTQLGPVRAQLLALAHHHQAWREGWNGLYASLYDVLQRTPPHLVPAAITFFAEQFPDVLGEAQMQQLAQSQGVTLPGGASGVGSQLIARLAQALVPSRPPPATAEQMEGFLVRVLTSLDAFATAFVGLRQGHEQFENEMVGSQRRAARPSPVDEATDPRAVLAYLLDWSAPDAQQRVDALRGNYAEIMTHQVALLSGLMEGVRKLLADRLSPARMARAAEERSVGFWKVWPFRGGLYWKQYLREHDDLSEDRELTTAVFGKVFARAYARALGENFAEAAPRRIGSSGGG